MIFFFLDMVRLLRHSTSWYSYRNVSCGIAPSTCLFKVQPKFAKYNCDTMIRFTTHLNWCHAADVNEDDFGDTTFDWLREHFISLIKKKLKFNVDFLLLDMVRLRRHSTSLCSYRTMSCGVAPSTCEKRNMGSFRVYPSPNVNSFACWNSRFF